MFSACIIRQHVGKIASVVCIGLFVAGCGSGTRYTPPGFTPQELDWERYHDAEKAGRLDEAAEGYESMCLADPPYRRACYDHARVLDKAGKKLLCAQSAARFVSRFPGDALAPTGVKLAGRCYLDMDRADDGIAALEELAADVKDKDAWDSVVYRIAKLHRSRKDTDSEERALEKIEKKGRWESQLWDNSIWRLIEISGERGDIETERRRLEKFLDSRERSYLIASYNFSHHDDALLRLGEIYFQENQLEEARALFMELANWKTSRMRDDGYLWAARVRLRQGKNGKACRLLAKIVEKMPAANTRKEAIELAGTAGCEQMKGVNSTTRGQ